MKRAEGRGQKAEVEGRGRREEVDVFAKRVLEIVSRIPRGRVITYGGVAKLAGKPRAARAVGRLMAKAPRPGLPYHRVIAAGGKVGGFGADPSFKVQLLAAEGVIVVRGRVRALDGRVWPDQKKRGPTPFSKNRKGVGSRSRKVVTSARRR